ncbi:MAG: hypothetical protein IPJ32_19765 [Sphingobacteriaceae bacterium]|nr:hypothetical protein [Sphingobacteriaceae bacterium]
MILFNIIQSDESYAKKVSEYLMQNSYALKVHIDINKTLVGSEEKPTIRLFFITKALLYTVIEKEVMEKFKSSDLLIYATPVSHVNVEYGELLRTKLKAV